MPTATSHKWNAACAPSQSVAAAHSPIRCPAGQTRAECDANEELNDADVADEVLIEETGIGHTRHQLIPRQWCDQHEEPVGGEK